MRRSHLLLVTVLGLGYLRPAPGTFGSLPPVLLALALLWFASPLIDIPYVVLIDLPLLLLAVLATAACLRFGDAAEQHFGRKDASPIVADEVAGQSIALLFLPWQYISEPGAWRWNVAIAATAFIAFRAMDIIKPPPARSLQRLKGGVGVVVDDLIAAIYALALAQIMTRFVLPAWM